LWREAGLSIHPSEGEIGFPRVATSFEFHRPLRFEQEFDVWMRIVAMTRKTIRYACLVTREETKIATGSLTIACVRRRPNEPMRAIEIPPEIAARLQVAPEV
jgi:acyl-CoA thioesterase FadM